MKYYIINRKQQINIFLYIAMFFLLPVTGIEEICDNFLFIPIIRLFFCIISIWIYLNNKKISIFMIIITFFCILLNISTIFNNGNLKGAVYGYFFMIISICCFYENNLNQQKTSYIYILYNYYFILILLNFLNIILLPNGLYIDKRGVEGFLLGNRNSFIITILPALSIGYHLLKIKKISLKKYIILWGICITTYIIQKSVTSIIGLSILGSFLIFFNNRNFRLIYNPITYIIFPLFLFYIIIINRSKFFYKLIINLTGKNVTFSGRTILWDKAISIISYSKMIGLGIQDEEYLIGQFNLKYAGHMHNLFLQILYQTGLIGCLLIGILLFLIARNLIKTSYNCISRSYGCTLFVLLVMLTTDFYGYYGIFPILLIINAYCKHIQNPQLYKNYELIRNQIND